MLRRILVLIFCCSLCGFAQSKRPFTFEDMMQLKRVGEPIVSPDGKWVGFSAVDVSLDENTRKPHLLDRSRQWWRGAPAHTQYRARRRSHSLFARRQTDHVRVIPRWQFADLGAGFRFR